MASVGVKSKIYRRVDAEVLCWEQESESRLHAPSAIIIIYLVRQSFRHQLGRETRTFFILYGSAGMAESCQFGFRFRFTYGHVLRRLSVLCTLDTVING